MKKKVDLERYPIYTLENSASECKAALKKLRDILDTKELINKKVERKYHTTVNQKCTILFCKYIGRCSAHDLRGVYATICTELYKPKTIDQNVFLSGILGHNWNDTDTAQSYKKFRL